MAATVGQPGRPRRGGRTFIPAELIALAVILSITAVAAAITGAVSPLPHLAVPTPTVSAAQRPSLSAPVLGPFSGTAVPRAVAQARPIAVIIDNNVAARPQVGISSASLTFETLTEGGITRLMSLFLEHQPPRFGPIRSLRPYFVTLAQGYQAILVHAGGSPQALQLLHHAAGIKNVEALSPHPGFRRDTARLAPHNLFAGAPAVRDIARSRDWDLPIQLPSFPHRAAPAAHRGTIKHIEVTFGTTALAPLPAYTVTYRFDSARDHYLRFVGGAPCMDELTHHQVTASNVLVMLTQIARIPGDTAGRVTVRVTGSGPAVLFRDGHELQGTWHKVSATAPLRFGGRNGAPLRLDPGPTWVEITSVGHLRTGRT